MLANRVKQLTQLRQFTMLANRVKQLTQLRQFVQRDRLNHQNLERYPPLYFMRKKLELQKEQRISLIHFQHLEERTSRLLETSREKGLAGKTGGIRGENLLHRQHVQRLR